LTKFSGPLLIGYFGYGNAGDEWILRLLSQSLPLPWSAVIGPDPRGIGAGLAVPRRPWKILKALSGSSALVFGGGELFQHRTSLRSLVYFLGLAILARLLGKPIFAYGISLDADLSAPARWLVRRALAGAQLWLRDRDSIEALGSGAYAPDAVWT